MEKQEFKMNLKRLMRQLDERAKKVNNNQRSDGYYQNKRNEFVEFIDNVKTESWFEFPKEKSRLWRIYYDVWN